MKFFAVCCPILHGLRNVAGNTKLTIPFGPDGKLCPRDDAKWIVDEGGCTIWCARNSLNRMLDMPLH
eukprot:925818-Amphidinium_carterae.1